MKILLILIALYYSYHLMFFMFSLLFKRKKPKSTLKQKEANNRFAVFVPAHDEENVIFNSVRSILTAHYPKEKYDVFVIADNCTDNTATLAELAGAKALIRHDEIQKGKQYALEWAFKQIDLRKYDAAVILDADNHIDPELFSILDSNLTAGHNVIQAYVETKNPADSWVSMNYAYMLWYMHRLTMIRSRMKMSAWLAGTGVCIRTKVLEKVGWNVTTLTDDVEYTCQLLLHGEKVYMAEDALVYDLKPVRIVDSMKQRLRWIRGQTQVTVKYLPKLFVHAWKSWFKGELGQAIRAFDATMWVPMQLIILASFGYSIATGPGAYLMAILLTTPIFYILPLVAERISLKNAWQYLVTSGVFFLTWIPITAYGVVTYGKQGWWRTPH